MLFERLTTKLSWLSLHARMKDRHELESHLEPLIDDLVTRAELPPAGRGALAVDVIYAVLRHVTWTGLPLFRSIMADALHQDHRITKASAESIALSICDLSAKSYPTPGGDKEFLRYIFILTCTLAEDENVVTSIGLGKTLLERIRDVTASAERQVSGSQKEPVFFASELDALLADIIDELADDYRDNPDAFRIQRLAMQWAKIPSSTLSWMDHAAMKKLWHLLHRVAGSKKTSSTDLWAWAVELGMLPDLASGLALEKTLSEAELLFTVEWGNGRPQSRRWQITSVCRQILGIPLPPRPSRISQTKDSETDPQSRA